MTVRKRFDRELYNQMDALAKDKVRELFKNHPTLSIVDNPKKMGVDLFIMEGETHVANVETEIKRVWKEKFKYDNVQFPDRKRKFAELETPTLFIMFNHDQSEYLVVTSKDLLSSPSVEVPNKYVYKGEYFFQVPLDKVTFNGVDSPLKKAIGV